MLNASGEVWVLGTLDAVIAESARRVLPGMVEATAVTVVTLPTPSAYADRLAERGAPRALVVAGETLSWAISAVAADQTPTRSLLETRILVEIPWTVAIAPELRAIARVRPDAALCVAGVDDAARSIGLLLKPRGYSCGTLYLLPVLDGDDDPVTADQLVFIALNGRRHARVERLAAALRLSTAALRARFSKRGLAPPARVLATCRALHAVILVHRGVPTRIAARRLGFASRNNLLAQVRRGLGRSLSTFSDIDTAMAAGRSRIRIERDRRVV
jgi:AraC-like DNA-binding protein